MHVASDLPKIAPNDRLTGTPEEYKASNQRSLSVFGTYRVDEEKKTVTYQITASTFPNWRGVSQRVIQSLTGRSSRTPIRRLVAGGRGSASNLYKRAKLWGRRAGRCGRIGHGARWNACTRRGILA
jgi:hypothetical protein